MAENNPSGILTNSNATVGSIFFGGGEGTLYLNGTFDGSNVTLKHVPYSQGVSAAAGKYNTIGDAVTAITVSSSIRFSLPMGFLMLVAANTTANTSITFDVSQNRLGVR